MAISDRVLKEVRKTYPSAFLEKAEADNDGLRTTTYISLDKTYDRRLSVEEFRSGYVRISLHGTATNATFGAVKPLQKTVIEFISENMNRIWGKP